VSVLLVLLIVLIALLVLAGIWWLLGQTTLTPNMKVLCMVIAIIVILIVVFSGAVSIRLAL
jgi:hypothetical protein